MSSANDVYLSATAHSITDDWTMESIILDIWPFPVRHTGINIAEALHATSVWCTLGLF